MAFFDEFCHLKIQLEDIKLATNNFGDTNFIGEGGFGKVYIGEISHSKGRGMAAFKRLDRRYGQGNSEFWKEIMMLSRHTHENLVCLLGYCDEGGEKILVYEHASRGSLDRHLSATTLTWTQRLKICLGAARGLNYLNDPKETQQRVLHRDIKSSNILLDENWNAKVSDLGLSKIGPANQQHTVLLTNVVGTHGYIDPLYMETYMLTKESDVYSFGVVLFEVLCGRLCFGFSNGQFETLVPMWKQSYKENKLDEIIYQDLLQKTDPSSLKSFSDIAYQCLHEYREERPTMARVVKELEIALEFQEISGVVEQPTDYEEIFKTEVSTLIYGSRVELIMLLSKGILVNGGKTWFSLNKNGEHCEMISAAECVIPSADNINRYTSKYSSRFAEGTYRSYDGRFKAHVRTRFLSPQITYTVNLVFKFYLTKENSTKQALLALKYKLEGGTKSSISYLADGREDGWMMVELFQFTSDRRTFDAKILFEGIEYAFTSFLQVEGIEFRPLEKVEHEAAEDEKVDTQPTSDSNVDREQKLPTDYEQIIKWSENSMEWTTKKELHSHFCKGFLINNGEEWFTLAKNGKKCLMLSARVALDYYAWEWQPLPGSRFEEVAFNPYRKISIVCKIKPQLLSPQTTYASYLVYKLQENHSRLEAPLKVRSKDVTDFFTYLRCPQTPIIRTKVDQNTHNPLNRPKMKVLPQPRNDGWMEVQVWEFQTRTTMRMVSMQVDLITFLSNQLYGLIVQGIEFKPI